MDEWVHTGGNFFVYLLIRGVDNFYAEYNRYPGSSIDVFDSDVNLLKKVLNKMLMDYKVSIQIKEEFIHEICRYGNSEIHSISGFLGGCAAHESIKLLTNQFVPTNNTLVYNGIKQTTSTYEL